MKKKERNSNFELMRIISMFFIIVWHIYMYGGIRNNPRIMNPSINSMFQIIIFLVIVHVNSFVLLSGYFQYNNKFKTSKLISLINVSLFYRIIVTGLLLVFGLITLSKVELLRFFSPLITSDNLEYWYIRIFILLYLFTPYLNILIKKITRQQHQRLLILSFVIFSIFPFISANKLFENYGYTLCNFIFLYFIGSYLSKYQIKEKIIRVIKPNTYRFVLLSLFFLLGIFNYCLYKTTKELMSYGSIFNEIFGNINSMHIAYSNPFVILQTITYFLFFESLSINSKFINKVAGLTLGIYLIHNNKYLTLFLYKWLKIDNGIVTSYKFIFYVFGMVFVIFTGCAIIELVRQIIFKFVYNRNLSKKFRDKFYGFINSFKTEEKEIKNE